MYKMNYKAIALAFLLQMIAGMIWYASTPDVFLGRALQEGAKQFPSVGLSLMFTFSVFIYLFFTAWLLSKVRVSSGVGHFFLVVSIWLFIILPNYVFVHFHLDISELDAVYILSYGIANCVITAVILPSWRPSRSIFKD